MRGRSNLTDPRRGSVSHSGLAIAKVTNQMPGAWQWTCPWAGETDSPLEQGGFKLPVPARTAVDCRPISLDYSSTKTTSGVRASRTRFGQLADQRVALRYR